MTVTLRPARSLDAGRTGDILHGFARENAWMPELHSLAETISFCGTMIDRGWVTVAETSDGIAGFLALDRDEIHSLYLRPSARRKGIGQQLLERAKSQSSNLSLFAFEANLGARRFYQRNGFVEAVRRDGSDNDECLPDIKYVWRLERIANG